MPVWLHCKKHNVDYPILGGESPKCPFCERELVEDIGGYGIKSNLLLCLICDVRFPKNS